MKILVTGGSGVLGSQVSAALARRRHAVTVASRNPEPIDGCDSMTLDIATGRGLEQLTDYDTILHLASHPTRFKEVDIEGTRHLLEQARTTGTQHLVTISIVGVDDHPFPYYRAKLAMEKLVTEGGVPWTLIRTTQFHELVPRFVDTLPNLGFVPAPSKVRLQPISRSVVAERLVALVESGASGRVDDLGGPEVLDLVEMARAYLRTIGSHRPVVPFPIFGHWAAGFRDGRMLVSSPTAGQTYAEYLSSL